MQCGRSVLVMNFLLLMWATAKWVAVPKPTTKPPYDVDLWAAQQLTTPAG